MCVRRTGRARRRGRGQARLRPRLPLTRVGDDHHHRPLIVPHSQEHVTAAAGRGHLLLLEVEPHLTLAAHQKVAGVFKQVETDLQREKKRGLFFWKTCTGRGGWRGGCEGRREQNWEMARGGGAHR